MSDGIFRAYKLKLVQNGFRINELDITEAEFGPAMAQMTELVRSMKDPGTTWIEVGINDYSTYWAYTREAQDRGGR